MGTKENKQPFLERIPLELAIDETAFITRWEAKISVFYNYNSPYINNAVTLQLQIKQAIILLIHRWCKKLFRIYLT